MTLTAFIVTGGGEADAICSPVFGKIPRFTAAAFWSDRNPGSF
jgi:hypothetical protein